MEQKQLRLEVLRMVTSSVAIKDTFAVADSYWEWITKPLEEPAKKTGKSKKKPG